MKRIFIFSSTVIFSVFLGSQIAEGFVLLPYWKMLSSSEFYDYYSNFGPIIGRFYTILTIVAAVVPLLITAYCYSSKSPALRYSVLSTIFALSFIAAFYVYFKGANQHFYNASLDAMQLRSALNTWGNWHWFRIFLEFVSLVFLILALNILIEGKKTITQ